MRQTDILNEIKLRLDIVDVISDYVNLKRAGSNFKGLCPFHSEKTPSFTVSPSKQFYYCFGCGEGGDIITFIRKIENLSFPETLERLARRAGIEYSPLQIKSDYNKQSIISSILSEAQEFYKENLNKNQEALDYLILKRQLSPDSIKIFSLGFAPRDWDSLFVYLKNKGFKEADIKEAGLISYSEKGSYDLFRGRIIFPIHNLQGNIIGFGGRVMDDGLPKYINSPETPLFKKGENLFGLFQAKDGIKKYGFAVITEGYLDVIMCHQYGFTNVIAPLGTALTEKQIMLLKKLTEKIILLYDGDNAGISAAKRSLPILLQHSIRPLIALLPEGEDPDSFLKKRGASELKGILETPLGLVDFYMKITEKGDSVEMLREFTGLIACIEDPLIRAEYIKNLSHAAGLKEEFLIEEIRRLRATQAGRSKTATSPSVASSGAKTSVLKALSPETLLVAAILQFPERAELILKGLKPEDIEEEDLRKLYSLIVDLCAQNPSLLKDDGKILLQELINQLNRDMEETEEKVQGLQHLIARLTFNTYLDEEGIDRLISDCLKQIRLRIMDRLIADARRRNDLILLNKLIKEKTMIQGLRRTITPSPF